MIKNCGKKDATFETSDKMKLHFKTLFNIQHINNNKSAKLEKGLIFKIYSNVPLKKQCTSLSRALAHFYPFRNNVCIYVYVYFFHTIRLTNSPNNTKSFP